MKKLLNVEKIVVKEQSPQNEQELIESMVTKVVKKESLEENPSTLCGVPSIESQVKHSYGASVSQIEEKPWRSGLGDEIVTDESECDSAIFKDNGHGDNSSIKSRSVLANLDKNRQCSYFEKCQSTKNNSELSLIFGLLITFAVYIIKLRLKCFIFK